jgi:tetratricopeptide (TPR) repeat protein
VRWLVALVVVAATAPAAAQSARYPKPPVDQDRQQERHSDLWDAATHPAKAEYERAVEEARKKLDQRQDGERKDAIDLLNKAIDRAPDEPAAYQLRGEAYLTAHDWARCADDFAAAIQHVHRDDAVMPDTRRDLAVCQSRAGRLADAERTLADAAAAGARNAELWMRLGETRIAMGKLDEARSALDTALDLTEGAAQTPILWLRALADDRARLPGAAEDDVRRALGFDRNRSMIDAPSLPLLGDGERDYALALSFADSDPREVEYATVYFRQFLEVAPKSPWRRRAEEHLHDLRAAELPLAVSKLAVSGNAAAVDLDAATRSVRATMPKLRACLAKLPGVLFQVQVTRGGPHSTDHAVNLPRYPAAPPDGAAVTPLLSFDATKADVDVAVRCVQPIAETMAMPTVGERDAYYRVVFDVIQ